MGSRSASQSMYVYSFFLLVVLLHFTEVENNPVEDELKIRLYRDGISIQYEEFQVKDALEFLNSSDVFNSSNGFVLMLHGAGVGADSLLVNSVVNAFGKSKKYKSYNLLAVDMPELYKMNGPVNPVSYYTLLRNTESVGELLGNLLARAVDQGLTTLDRIHLIGYSMGAHLAGYMARQVKKTHGFVYYIAGLEPAGPGFSLPYWFTPSAIHVSKEDAQVTHLFHSNSYHLGSGRHTGTADFVFNNGFWQPNCTFTPIMEVCSHSRSVRAYAKAIMDDSLFVGRSCSSWLGFMSCACEKNECRRISFPPDPLARGTYYLRMKGASPYGKGQRGATCHFKAYWSRLTQNMIAETAPQPCPQSATT